MTPSIAILASVKPSDWVSCRVIVKQLAESYKIYLGKRARFFRYENSMSHWEVLDLARQIRASRPERLVFIDHSPHPAAILKALEATYNGSRLPGLYFHLFGDFTLMTKDWASIDSTLAGNNATFICASERQARLVSTFLNSPQQSIQVCPFPVDTNQYRFLPKKRIEQRKRLGIEPDEFAILYAGRLSLQKNITWLLRCFSSYCDTTRRNSKLFLCGSFDDIAAPFHGIAFKPGAYFLRFEKERLALPLKVRDRIHYLGHLNESSLMDMYCAADVYASLSLHHDEDYGMAPAESLCCGTPVILTDWGGYASFYPKSPRDVSLVDVTKGGQGVRVSLEGAVTALEHWAKADDSEENKVRRGTYFQSLLSPLSTARVLKKIHRNKIPVFGGFNSELRHHAALSQFVRLFPAAAKEGQVYDRFYRTYLKEGNAL